MSRLLPVCLLLTVRLCFAAGLASGCPPASADEKRAPQISRVTQTHQSRPLSPGIVRQRPASGRYVQIEGGFMVAYQVPVPGTDQTIWMEPIPGGEFVMGSPGDEPGRTPLEGPPSRWKTAPFWMSRCEITQGQFRPYMNLYSVFRAHEFRRLTELSSDDLATQQATVDAVTSPTQLYEPDFHFEYGRQDRMPMVTATLYSAKQYSKWLSAVTGSTFRLPTEAEWEYACRAGSRSRFHFGDDARQLADYAWFKDNAYDDGHHVVGEKRPNAWGLYDMHGNVAEWTYDHCVAYEASSSVRDAQQDWIAVAKIDPRAVRGGSFESTADACRSAARLPSDHELWREYDPDLPKSPWWMSSDVARSIGLRIVRPLEPMTARERGRFWEADNQETFQDVQDRLREGRGAIGRVSRELMLAVAAREARRKAELAEKIRHAEKVRRQQQP